MNDSFFSVFILHRVRKLMYLNRLHFTLHLVLIYYLLHVSYRSTTGHFCYTLTKSTDNVSTQEASGPEHGGCYSAERRATPFAFRDEGMMDLPVLDCNRPSSQHHRRAGTCMRRQEENVTDIRYGVTKCANLLIHDM